MAKVIAALESGFLVEMSDADLNLIAGWSDRYNRGREWHIGDEFSPAEMYKQLQVVAEHKSEIRITVDRMHRMADKLAESIDVEFITAELKETKP